MMIIRLVVYGILSLGLILVMLTAAAWLSYAAYANDIHDKERLMNRNKNGLLLLDRDGKPFFSFYQAKNDTYISLDQIPLSVQQAVIAMEDRTFYSNPGFSIRGILRAVWVNLISGKIVQGGSTITQELVKNLLLSNQQSWWRKFQEIVLAAELSRIYSKDQILEMYLNSVYFGEGAFGIESAAETYFGIHANQLSPSQAALLIGLLPAPSQLSPLSNNPDLAKARQQVVLRAMVNMGAISQLKAVELGQEPIVYTRSQDSLNTTAFHFALYVRDLLIHKFGEETIIRSGFTVRTTLKRDWQQQAEGVVAARVAALASDNASNGAVVVIDPQTGQIMAMVGSVDWHNNEFGKMNMAITPRQVGSSFKPIIYSTAFEEGVITPASILEDQQTEFPQHYVPQDYDGQFRGPVTVRRALANSLNVPAVEVMQQVGVPRGLDMARQFGITSLGGTSDYGLSMVLGAGEVPLVELTNAYAVFAAQGIYHPLTAILEIRDKYNQVIPFDGEPDRRVISPGTAFLISSILSDTKARAEEFGNVLNINRTAAVKTGTSQDFRNALTVGYTPHLVIGVWVGNNNNDPMDKVAGSLGAAPIWKQLMTQFLDGYPDEAFNPPDSIAQDTVCPYSGTDSSLASSSAYPEYFLAGTEPSSACNVLTQQTGPESIASYTVSQSSAPQPTPTDMSTPMPVLPSPTPEATPDATPNDQRVIVIDPGVPIPSPSP